MPRNYETRGGAQNAEKNISETGRIAPVCEAQLSVGESKSREKILALLKG